MRALHRPNGGAAAARNTGLDAAAGEWVLFVDADDELLPGLWDALPSALAAAPGMILFGLTRQSGPAPCPLAPGVFPRLADVGAALEPLLFESGYLAAPYPKLFNAAALRQGGRALQRGAGRQRRRAVQPRFSVFFTNDPLPFIACRVYTISKTTRRRAVCPGGCAATCWTPRP